MAEKITIYTIAEETGLTPTAVSRAFNPSSRLDPEKRRLVLETAAKYGFTPNRMASRLSMREIKIGIIIYAGYMPFCEQIIAGIESAKRRMTDYKINCDLRLLPRENVTREECVKVLRELVDGGCEGIITSGMYDWSYPELKKAADMGCRVVFINYPPEPGVSLFSSMQNAPLAGRIAADFMRAAGKKSTLLLTGYQTMTLHRQVMRGFLDLAAEYGMSVPEIYDINSLPHADREEALTDLLTRLRGEIDSVYITSGESAELCRVIERLFAPGELTVLTSDIYPELCRYIESGLVSATIYQNQAKQAERAYELLAGYLMKTIPEPENVEITPVLVTRSLLPCYSGFRT